MGEPRRAFVTGAASGIGQAIALALAREGYDLVLTELRPGSLAELLRHPDLKARCVLPVHLDLREENSIGEAFDRALAEFGAIDVLVNNAGRTMVKPVVEVSPAEWDNIVDTNLKGTFFLTQRFGRACIEHGRPGIVVTIASTHGIMGMAGRSVYGIAKAGLIQMTKMLAIEWAGHNIRVNAVAPGTVLTSSRAAMYTPEVQQRMLARIPAGRFITPEEVAAAVVYLASPRAGSTTGHTLVVDGGLTVY